MSQVVTTQTTTYPKDQSIGTLEPFQCANWNNGWRRLELAKCPCSGLPCFHPGLFCLLTRLIWKFCTERNSGSAITGDPIAGVRHRMRSLACRPGASADPISRGEPTRNPL